MASDYGLVPTVSNVRETPPSLESVRELGSKMGGEGKEQGDRNPRIPPGFTFLGQFLGHDLTHDSRLSQPENNQAELRNRRTPALDLDSLYRKSDSQSSPELYDHEQRGKFLHEEGIEFDLPRDPKGEALIGDERNDRNLILAQLHLAFMKFHNAVYDRINSILNDLGGLVLEGRFERTQCLVRWHYQWIILREYLPLLVGPRMVCDILKNDLKWYKWRELGRFIPLEFSVAAYRFGHSQVHYLYRINDRFQFPLFSAESPSKERQDLRGGPVKKKHTVNWKNFFHTGAKPTPSWDRASKKINTKLSGPLLFPQSSNRSGESPQLASTSLAVRDLKRGQSRRLPSGQTVAKEMEDKKIDVAVRNGKKAEFDTALKDLAASEKLKRETPLWYYILKEAEVQYGGMMLGDVGGRIVAEVIIGLLQADSSSLWEKVDLVHLCKILQKDPDLEYKYDSSSEEIDPESLRHAERTWRPVLPIGRNRDSADFTMADLLKFAGVDTQ